MAVILHFFLVAREAHIRNQTNEISKMIVSKSNGTSKRGTLALQDEPRE